MRRFFVILLTLVASSAHGAVYTWKDSKGASNFTNRQDEIPARYSSKAKLLYPELGDPASARQITPSLPVAAESAPQPSAVPVQAISAPQPTVRATPPQNNNASRPNRRATRAKRAAGEQEE